MNKYFWLIFFVSITFCLDYSFEDVNSTSLTFGEVIGPSYFLNQDKLTITYFGWET